MPEPSGSIEQSNDKIPPGEFLADEAKHIAEDLKSKASEAAESVKSAAQYEVDEIGVAAKEIVGDATDKVKTVVTEQKAATADYLTNISRAVQRAAGEFEKDVPQAARYIRRAGAQLGDVADAVRQREPRELVSEVEDFARRQPALFFGGAVVLGFAALRFLKSASPAPVQGNASVK